MTDKKPGPQLSHPVTRDGTAIPFFPIGRRVVIERLEPESVMGGIIIPQTSQVQMGLATVLAAGPVAQGVLDDAGIQIGDTVAIAKYSGLFWNWQPAGTTSTKDRHTVDIIQVDDILGCQELAEKMFDGRLGIELHDPDGDREYRFIQQTGMKAA